VATERRAGTSRLEGFSDAVFAFALTLLVVSLEVPSSYDQLVHTLRSFVAFAPSFAALIWIWYLHREFFRRYGLGDGPMVVLNALLLFFEVVNARSISSASKKLDIPKSTVSRKLMFLEDQLAAVERASLRRGGIRPAGSAGPVAGL